MSMSANDLLSELQKGGKLQSYWRQNGLGRRRRVHTLVTADNQKIGVQMSSILPLLKSHKLLSIRWSGDIDEYILPKEFGIMGDK